MGELRDVLYVENPELIVFDQIVPVFEPALLSESEWVDLLRDASLSAPWGCGNGFAASTEDQRVGLTVYGPADSVAERVALPNAGWRAEIRVGKHLFANHCNDMALPWDVSPTAVATWQIVEGVLVYIDPSATPFECSAEPIEAQLIGAVVDTPAGPIYLPDIHLVNNAYNCFAG